MTSRISRILTSRVVFAPLAGLGLMTVAACAHANAGHDHSGATEAAAALTVSTSAVGGRVVRADVIGLDGKSLGSVTLQDTHAGVLVSTDISGIPAGEHGFHFHQKGACDPAAKFDSAGGHFTGGDLHHGFLTANGPHGGDMPNQNVGGDGLLKAQILNTGVTFAPGVKSLFDADGTALVIHAGPDDYTSQPAGNAGGRIACAVISRAQ